MVGVVLVARKCFYSVRKFRKVSIIVYGYLCLFYVNKAVFLQEQNVKGSLMTPCVKYRGSKGDFRGSYFHGGCLQVFHLEAIIINNILMFFIRIASV